MKWLWSRADREVLGINRRNLEHVFADYRPGKFRDLDDKLRCKERLGLQEIPVPRTLLVISSHADLPRLDELMMERDELVLKPARGSRGRGILVLRHSGDGWLTPGGRVFDTEAIHDHVDEALSGHFSLDEAPDRVLVESRIHSARSIRSLYPGGLSDIRVVVEDGEPLQAMLRVPTAASDGRANLHEGGIGIGIDLETGRTVHAVQDGRVVSRHPDTGEELIGRQLPEFERILEVSRGVARAFAEIRYLGVDLVLDTERGVLVLEVNARPGLAIQVANQQGQKVRRRVQRSGFERFTEHTSWALLVLLAVAPVGYAFWHESADPVIEPVRTGEGSTAEEPETLSDAGGVEWSDASEPVSTRNDQFAAALTAIAAGDTTRALSLYEEAAADPAVRPFALNNVALIHKARGELAEARSVLALAVESYPSYQRGHYNLGLVRRDLGDRDAALQSFLRSVELRPSHARSWSRLGELYLASEDWDSAVEALQRAIRFDPDAVADRRRLGSALLEIDRPGEAAHRYEEALALSPGSWTSELGYLRARLAHLAHGTGGPSTGTLDSLESRYLDAARRHPGSFATAGAQILWWRGDPRGALDRIASVPDHQLPLEAVELRELLELEIGAFDELLARDAAPDRQRLHDLARWSRYLDRPGLRPGETPPDAKSRMDPVVRVLAVLATGGEADATLLRAARMAAHDDTEREWIEAVTGTGELAFVPTLVRLPTGSTTQRAPLPTPALVWSASILAERPVGIDDPAVAAFIPHLRARFTIELARGATEIARELGLRLLRVSPNDADVLVVLARIELELDDVGFARALFDQIPPAGRRRPDARLVEARLLLAEGRRREARVVIRDLLRQDPSSVESLEILSAIQIADRDPDKAIATLGDALLIEPGRQDLRERLARALMAERRYPEAEKEWTRVLDLDIDARLRRSAIFNLALSVQRQDRDEEAIRLWTQLLIEYPDHARAHFNLGLAYERSGRTAEAISEFRRVLELDPDHDASRERLQRLDPTQTGDS